MARARIVGERAARGTRRGRRILRRSRGRTRIPLCPRADSNSRHAVHEWPGGRRERDPRPSSRAHRRPGPTPGPNVSQPAAAVPAADTTSCPLASPAQRGCPEVGRSCRLRALNSGGAGRGTGHAPDRRHAPGGRCDARCCLPPRGGCPMRRGLAVASLVVALALVVGLVGGAPRRALAIDAFGYTHDSAPDEPPLMMPLAASPPDDPPFCTTPVAGEVVLDQDVKCSGGLDVLSGAVLDLNGFTLEAEISLSGGTIKNGTLSGSHVYGGGGVLEDLRVLDGAPNLGFTIQAEGNTRITRCYFAGNDVAVDLYFHHEMSSTLVEQSLLEKNGAGVNIAKHNFATLSSNIFRDNLAGVYVWADDGGGASWNTVSDNDFEHNHYGIRILAKSCWGPGLECLDDNQVLRNRFIGNRRSGVSFDSTRCALFDANCLDPDFVIADNFFSENGFEPDVDSPTVDDGISAVGAPAEIDGLTIARNVAVSNRDLGIEAPNATDGGGNRASGNGNPLQCVGVTCTPAWPVSLTPEISLNAPGGSHTVTAQVIDEAGAPKPDAYVEFSVTDGPNAGASGVCTFDPGCTTDADGYVFFTYQSNGAVGVDRITATSNGTASNTVLEFWDADCNENEIPDACDLSCGGADGQCAAYAGCGGSLDTDDNGEPVAITITSIRQDETLTSPSSGSFSPDGQGVGTDTALLRAEREGGGDGRVYHVGFSAEDGRGGSCTGTVTACVPPSMRPGHACIDQGALYDSTVYAGGRPKRGCGLGFELVILAPLLARWARKRRLERLGV